MSYSFLSRPIIPATKFSSKFRKNAQNACLHVNIIADYLTNFVKDSNASEPKNSIIIHHGDSFDLLKSLLIEKGFAEEKVQSYENKVKNCPDPIFREKFQQIIYLKSDFSFEWKAIDEMTANLAQGGTLMICPTNYNLTKEIPRNFKLRHFQNSSGDWTDMSVFEKIRPTFMKNSLIYARGSVGEGFGRGGKKLGFPTANLKPLDGGILRKGLDKVRPGVYVGWARLSQEIGDARKAVVNIGFSPTFEERNPEKLIEAHIIDHTPENDFYGEMMALVLVGFLRDEKKFNSFQELIANIERDVDEARMALDFEPYLSCREKVKLKPNDSKEEFKLFE
eukprot:CAMPEP_0171458894 /NCGR_PEP_ID=MMETSP0945-20130129/4392_1 /TAXON_ID=109269 /ORGANISM="Vaucheria litorea, Strain CCMP2940" /LENGTH=335 /DNA_ID=CAMNT_0011984797 /DNA_START=90 /DNA_END=1097 /DNA_ORIENTATION=-